MTKTNNHSYMVKSWIGDKIFYPILSIFLLLILLLPLFVRRGSVVVMVLWSFTFSLFFLYFLRGLYRSFTYLVLYREGIEIHRLLRKIQFLPWEKPVKIRSRWWDAGLILSTTDGGISFRLDFSCDNSQLLFDIIQCIQSDIFQCTTPLTLYTVPIFSVLFFVVIGEGVYLAFMGAFTYYIGMSIVFYALLFIILIGSAMMILASPYSMTIFGDSIYLRFLLRKKVIHANEISQITQVPRFAFIFDWSGIILKLRSGEKIDLMLFQIGISLLSAFLAAWYQNATMPKLGEGDNIDRAAGREMLAGLPAKLP